MQATGVLYGQVLAVFGIVIAGGKRSFHDVLDLLYVPKGP